MHTVPSLFFDKFKYEILQLTIEYHVFFTKSRLILKNIVIQDTNGIVFYFGRGNIAAKIMILTDCKIRSEKSSYELYSLKGTCVRA